MIQCACGSHDTDIVTLRYEYEYRGYVQTVERSYTECQDCGLEFQVVSQIEDHTKQIYKAKLGIDYWIFCQYEKQFKRRQRG